MQKLFIKVLITFAMSLTQNDQKVSLSKLESNIPQQIFRMRITSKYHKSFSIFSKCDQAKTWRTNTFGYAFFLKIYCFMQNQIHKSSNPPLWESNCPVSNSVTRFSCNIFWHLFIATALKFLGLKGCKHAKLYTVMVLHLQRPSK